MKLLTLFSILFCSVSFAETDQLPLWEYGIGLGYIHYAHYPSSNQTNDIALPFPTFQYRGKVLRADDREGTRAYLLKGDLWSLEFSGSGLPALSSKNNSTRTGMPDLPWMAHLGPLVIAKFSESFEFKLGFFQAISTDFKLTQTNGQLLHVKFIYQPQIRIYEFPNFGFLSLELKTASRDYLATYFEIRPEFSTMDRPMYEARSGFLSTELQYYQALKIKRTTFYAGISLVDYSMSANLASPLHKANLNLSYLAGVTYTLGESKD